MVLASEFVFVNDPIVSAKFYSQGFIYLTVNGTLAVVQGFTDSNSFTFTHIVLNYDKIQSAIN
jgi:uncharacterized integral membrane protein